MPSICIIERRQGSRGVKRQLGWIDLRRGLVSFGGLGDMRLGERPKTPRQRLRQAQLSPQLRVCFAFVFGPSRQARGKTRLALMRCAHTQQSRAKATRTRSPSPQPSPGVPAPAGRAAPLHRNAPLVPTLLAAGDNAGAGTHAPSVTRSARFDVRRGSPVPLGVAPQERIETRRIAVGGQVRRSASGSAGEKRSIRQRRATSTTRAASAGTRGAAARRPGLRRPRSPGRPPATRSRARRSFLGAFTRSTTSRRICSSIFLPRTAESRGSAGERRAAQRQHHPLAPAAVSAPWRHQPTPGEGAPVGGQCQ